MRLNYSVNNKKILNKLIKDKNLHKNNKNNINHFPQK